MRVFVATHLPEEPLAVKQSKKNLQSTIKVAPLHCGA